MERLIVDIDSEVKARELRAILEELGFVRKLLHIQHADDSMGILMDEQNGLRVRNISYKQEF